MMLVVVVALTVGDDETLTKMLSMLMMMTMMTMMMLMMMRSICEEARTDALAEPVEAVLSGRWAFWRNAGIEGLRASLRIRL